MVPIAFGMVLALGWSASGDDDQPARPAVTAIEHSSTEVTLSDTIVDAVLNPAAPPLSSSKYTLLNESQPSLRAFGDTFDIAVMWFCPNAGGYLTDTGSGPTTCLQEIYDGQANTCGDNVFTDIPVIISEAEIDNGNGTTTVIVQAASADGSDMFPADQTCPGGPLRSDHVDVGGCDIGKIDGGGPGIPGDPLDPDLPITPLQLLEAKAVVFGAGGAPLLDFNLASAGTTPNDLKDRFTVGGVDQVSVTALQFRYLIVTGEPRGACCETIGSCTNNLTQAECIKFDGSYLGDFSVCPGPFCGPPPNDDCDGATTATIGENHYDTSNATLHPAPGLSCASDPFADLWYLLELPASGLLKIDLCDGPDTFLEVYGGQTCPPGPSLGCSDNEPECGPGGLGASLELPVDFGQQITIRIGGKSAGISGSMSISLAPLPVTEPPFQERPPEPPPSQPTAEELYQEAIKKYGISTPEEIRAAGAGTRPVGEDPTIDPVYLFSGEFYKTEQDLLIPGRGLHFVWARKYRSRMGPNTTMGNGWDFSYNVFLEENGANLVVHDGNTRTDVYTPQPDGVWIDGDNFNEITQELDGSYTLTFPDSGKWRFHAFTGSMQDGRLAAIVDRNGNTLTLDYDAQGRLITIHDTLDTGSHNRDITIDYNSNGFIGSVTDWTGRQVRYEYYNDGDAGGSFGDLKSVTTPVVVGTPNGNDFPDGKTTTYTYTKGFPDERLNHDLLTATDGKGQTWLINEYAHTIDPGDPRHTLDPGNFNFDRIVKQTWGDTGDIVDLVYVPQSPDASNNFAVIRTIANDRMGNVKEFFYDDLNRGVMLREYTGRAPDPDAPTTETVNRPVGQLRPGDPAFFETRYEFNSDSLITRVINPNGSIIERVYESDLSGGGLRGAAGGGCCTGPTGCVNVASQAQCDGMAGTYLGDGNPCGAFFNVEALTTTIHFDTCNSAYDTLLEVYDQCGGTLLAANDNCSDTAAGGGADTTSPCFDSNPASTEDGSCTCLATTAGQDLFVRVVNFDGGPPTGGTSLSFQHGGPCSTLPAGACCVDESTCEDRTRESFCAGSYAGDDTACATTSCTPPVPRRLQGNLREIRYLPGPLGGDQAEIVNLFEYDAGLGGCCGTNFVTRHVDGRGNETIYDYDSNGNRTLIIRRIPSIVETFEYNSFGQMTARVLPDNGSGHQRRDEYTYHASGPQMGYLHQQIIDATGLALTTTHEYDSLGRLTREVDPRGNDSLFVVNALDQIVRRSSAEVTPASGVRYEIDTFFDANNNVVRVDVENVDEAGLLGSNTHFSVVYEYETLNNVTRTCREVGSANLGPSDLDCSALPAGQFIVTETQYDANRNPTLTRHGESTNGNQPANLVRTLYDERDLVFREVRGEGHPNQSTTQYDYDERGNRSAVRQGLEGAPRVTSYEYDGYDRLVSMTDAMGNVAEYHYDGNHNRVSLRIDGELTDLPGAGGNVRLSETLYVYDAMDRRTRTEVSFFDTLSQNDLPGGQQAGKSIHALEYSHNSQVIRAVDDNGHETLTAYDTVNRRSQVTDAKGNTTAYEYDANSNVVRVTSVDKSDLGGPDESFVTSNAYDGLDRLVRVLDNDQNTIEQAYDSRGNRTVMTDALRPVNPSDPGNVTRYAYDGLNRLTTTTRLMTDDGTGTGNPAGSMVTRQAWDDSSRLVSRTDDKLNVTTYNYDPLDRMTLMTYADGATRSRNHDVHDNLVQMTDANGSVIGFEHDLLNRLTLATVSPGPGVSSDTTQETYQYDGLSRLVRAEDDDSLVTRRYDSLNGVVAEVLTINPGEPNESTGTVVSGFDGEGNKLGCTYPGGRAMAWTYDDLDRMKTIADGGGTIATYDYVGASRVQRRTYNACNTRTDFAYDNVKRIVGTTHTFDPGGANTIIDARTYAWDRMSNKTQRADVRAGGPQLTHNYAYDSTYRLTRATVTDALRALVRDTDYSLDGAGNRFLVAGAPDSGVHLGGYTMMGAPPKDLPVNQYTETPESRRTYDANGNLLSMGLVDIASFAECVTGPGGGISTNGCTVFDFLPDADVDLADYAELQRSPVASAGRVARMRYDYRNQMVEYRDIVLGQRHTYAYDALSRRIARVLDADGADGGPIETRYHYDGQQVIEEQSALGQALATYVYGRYIDEVLNMQRGSASYYYHADDLHNVMALTDNSGSVVERYEYHDYGQPRVMDAGGTDIGQSVVGNPCLFTGRRYDPESSLYYFRTRYLDPSTGRFTTRDRIGIWGDAINLGNGYTYAANNPATFQDPTGQTVTCTGVSGFIGLKLAVSGQVLACEDDCCPRNKGVVVCVGAGVGIGGGVGGTIVVGTGCITSGYSGQLTAQGNVGPLGGSASVAIGSQGPSASAGVSVGEGAGGALTIEGCSTWTDAPGWLQNFADWLTGKKD